MEFLLLIVLAVVSFCDDPAFNGGIGIAERSR